MCYKKLSESAPSKKSPDMGDFSLNGEQSEYITYKQISEKVRQPEP